MNKRLKKTLVCAENYCYTRVNDQKLYTYWKCSEFRRLGCPARVKTKTGDCNVIKTSSSEHTHLSDLGKVEYLRAESAVLETARNNPSLPPRSLLADLTNKVIVLS